MPNDVLAYRGRDRHVDRVPCGPGSAVSASVANAQMAQQPEAAAAAAHPQAPELGLFVRELEAAVVPPHDQESLPEWSERDVYQAENVPKEEGPILLRGHRPRQHAAFLIEALQRFLQRPPNQQARYSCLALAEALRVCCGSGVA